MEKEADPEKLSHGGKTVLIVVAVAFIASATTAMLAFTASHRARERDAKALAADTAELRGDLATWHTQMGEALNAPEGNRQPYLDRLVGHTQALSAWKARTPCGQEARNRLQRAMEEHVRALLRGGQPPDHANESAVLDEALRACGPGE